MATRSFIARYNPDTEDYTAIYCHWDGYPTGVGLTLRDHYNVDEKVQFLLEQGDISSLRESVVETKEESYKVRGDTDVDARTFSRLPEMVEYYSDMGCEWGYIWETDGKWDAYELDARGEKYPPAKFFNLYKIESANV